MEVQEVEQPSPARRLTGTLVRKHENGYGFIAVGEGEPDYFILKSKVPIACWREGQSFEFTPGEARKPGEAPLALDPKPVAAVHRRAYRA